MYPVSNAFRMAACVLREPAPRLGHVHPEAVELDPAETPAHAEDGPTLREVVEHGEALGDPHRVVPGQDGHHGAELDA